MEKTKIFLFIYLLMLISPFTQGQNLIDINYTRPPLNQLRADDLWNFTLKNNSNQDLEFTLYGTLTESKAGLIATGQTMAITLRKGETKKFKVSDLPKTPDINYIHPDERYKNALIRTGNLPNGTYTICIIAKQEGTNEELGEDCIEQDIEKTSEAEISLLTPENNATLIPDEPIIFTWLPIGNLESGSTYKIKIVEITGDESPENAMLKSKAFFEKDGIKTTTFNYNFPKTNIDNKKFVWRIEADDKSVLSNIHLLNFKRKLVDTVIECATMIGYEKRIKDDLDFKRNVERLESLTKKFIEDKKQQKYKSRSVVTTIPVVVHIIHYGEPEGTGSNLSEAQIQSQIDALNRDFRKLNSTEIQSIMNPDPNAPWRPVFGSIAGDSEIEFRLANIDPNCFPTNGITRTQTSIPIFIRDDNALTPELRDPIKFTSTGGKDGWPSNKYLNIWVCRNIDAVDFSGMLGGYATLPAGLNLRPNEDGIVMYDRVFGTFGDLVPNYNKGRTLVHEVGHWLNLQHIWGNSYCGNDYVNDTPTQSGPNMGAGIVSCLTARYTCGNYGMTNNYMDYHPSDDCKFMFSIGQCDRMRATLLVRNELSDFPCEYKCDGRYFKFEYSNSGMYPDNYVDVEGRNLSNMQWQEYKLFIKSNLPNNPNMLGFEFYNNLGIPFSYNIIKEIRLSTWGINSGSSITYSLDEIIIPVNFPSSYEEIATIRFLLTDENLNPVGNILPFKVGFSNFINGCQTNLINLHP